MWALILIKIATISFWVSTVWVWVWVRWGRGKPRSVCMLLSINRGCARVCTVNVEMCVCVSQCGCMCWVSQLCYSSSTVKECPVPLMQSLIMVLTTWSLTPHCIMLRDHTCSSSTHSLTQCGRAREEEDEEGLPVVNSRAYFSLLFQNISPKDRFKVF